MRSARIAAAMSAGLGGRSSPPIGCGPNPTQGSRSRRRLGGQEALKELTAEAEHWTASRTPWWISSLSAQPQSRLIGDHAGHRKSDGLGDGLGGNAVGTQLADQDEWQRAERRQVGTQPSAGCDAADCCWDYQHNVVGSTESFLGPIAERSR